MIERHVFQERNSTINLAIVTRSGEEGRRTLTWNRNREKNLKKSVKVGLNSSSRGEDENSCETMGTIGGLNAKRGHADPPPSLFSPLSLLGSREPRLSGEARAGQGRETVRGTSYFIAVITRGPLPLPSPPPSLFSSLNRGVPLRCRAPT